MIRFLLFALSSLLVGQASAAVIAAFDYNGGSAASTDTSVYSATGDYDPRTAEIAALGTAFAGDSAISSASETAFMLAQNTPNSTNPATTELYHDFSLTVQNLAAGETLDITSLEFDYFRTGGGGNFFLGPYSDRVGYTGTGDKLGTANINTDARDSFIIDLTSANAVAGTSFTGLTNGETVEFRFTFGDTTGGNTSIHRLDNIVLNGSVVAVPEPSSMALFLLGGLWISARRSRSRDCFSD